MIERDYQELKDFFLPFVMERYGGTAVSSELRKIIEDTAKAFLWCILSTTNDMHLKEITTISLAESLYEKGLYNLLTYLEIGATKINMEGMFLAFSVEIHNWLLFLHNNGKLKGIYDRFTGFYKFSE